MGQGPNQGFTRKMFLADPGSTRGCTLDITNYKIESPGKSPLSPPSWGLGLQLIAALHDYTRIRYTRWICTHSRACKVTGLFDESSLYRSNQLPCLQNEDSAILTNRYQHLMKHKYMIEFYDFDCLISL